MSYFLTKDQYAPGSLYITDASLDLVKQWCEATGERLRCYFVDGYVDPGEIEDADEYPDKLRLSASQIRMQIEEAQREHEAARRMREHGGNLKSVTSDPFDSAVEAFMRACSIRLLRDLCNGSTPEMVYKRTATNEHTQEEY